MNWRERIVEAQVRGGFTAEDVDAAERTSTCAVGEASRTTGLDYQAICWLPEPVVAIDADYDRPMPTSCLGGAFTRAIKAGNMRAADSILDAIEDRCLLLKRDAPSNVGRTGPDAGAGSPQGGAAQ